MTNRRTFSILALITICGFLLRLIFLLNRGPLWFDEIWSVHFSSLPWAEAWRYWIVETNPFLYTLITRGVVHFFGDGANTVRIFSLLIGTACIPLTYTMARIFESDRTTALIATALVAISQNHIFYSGEARTYALLCFLTILSFIFLLRILSSRSNTQTLIFYGITLLFTLYSHLTALALVPIQFFIIFLAYRRGNLSRPILKKLLITLALVGITFALWLIPSALQKMNAGLFNGWYFTTANEYSGNILQSITTLFIDGSTPATGLLVFSIFCMVAFFYFAINLRDQNKSTLGQWTLLAWAIFPITIAACFGQYISKFFVFCLPAIALILATFGKVFSDSRMRTSYYILIIIIPLTTTFSALTYSVFEPSSITNFIEKRATANSAVIINPFHEILTWERYYHGPAKLIGAYPIDDQLNWNNRIAEYNWQRIPISEPDLKKWYNEKLQVNQFDKIFFIESYIKPSDNVTLLLRMGWRYAGRNTDENSGNHYMNYYVHELLPPIQSTSSTPSNGKNKSK